MQHPNPFFAAVLFVAAIFAGAQPARSQTLAEQYLVSAIDAERAAHNLPKLLPSPALATAARRHAERMRQEHAIAHQFSDERELGLRAAEAGAHLSHVTENVGSGDGLSGMHSAFMRSPHHREHILDARVTSIGVAVVPEGGRFWIVEDFGRDIANLTLSQQEQQVLHSLAAAGMSRISATENARDTCRMQTGYAGPRPWFVIRYTTSDLGQLPEQLQTRLLSPRYQSAAIGACPAGRTDGLSTYSLAVLLFP